MDASTLKALEKWRNNLEIKILFGPLQVKINVFQHVFQTWNKMGDF